MKKIISVVSIVFIFFLTLNVYAITECTTEEMNRLKELANNVEFKYDYVILDEFEDKKTLDVYYTFNIFNYDKDLKIYYQTEYSDEKVFLSNDNTEELRVYQGKKIDFYIYAYTTNLCTSELIKKTTITLPYYNTFYYFTLFQQKFKFFIIFY